MKKTFCAFFALLSLNLSAAQVGFNNPYGFVSTNAVTQWSKIAVNGTSIAAAGYLNGNPAFAALALYTSDGTLDTTFNHTGLVVSDFQASVWLDVAFDGTAVVVVGSQASSTTPLIARYTSNGGLDGSFGAGAGFITTDAANAYSWHGVVLDGSYIIVAGTNGTQGLIARYKSDGTLDSNFANGAGFVTSTAADLWLAVALDESGNILVAGETGTGGYGVVARYTPLGALDTTFNPPLGSVTSTADDTNAALWTALALDGNEPVVVGQGHNDDDVLGAVIARYNFDGTLDKSFNGTGFTFNSMVQVLQGVAIDATGGIVVVGKTAGENARAIVLRYTPTGAFDTTFNMTGYVISTAQDTDGLNWYGVQFVDGVLLVCGLNFDLDALLVQYFANGVLATSSNWNRQAFTAQNKSQALPISLLG